MCAPVFAHVCPTFQPSQPPSSGTFPWLLPWLLQPCSLLAFVHVSCRRLSSTSFFLLTLPRACPNRSNARVVLRIRSNAAPLLCLFHRATPYIPRLHPTLYEQYMRLFPSSGLYVNLALPLVLVTFACANCMHDLLHAPLL